VSELHITRIRRQLERQFEGHIDLVDCDGRPDSEREAIYLSRALAALAITAVTEATEQEAGKAVTDGFDDNGIDAFYFDPFSKSLYVAQSKWSASGKGSIPQGECKKFLDGVEDLVAMNLDNFNDKVGSRRAELEEALFDARVTVKMLLIHTGVNDLAKHARRDIDARLRRLNDAGEVFSAEDFGQADVYELVAGRSERRKINLDITLRGWAAVESPYRAYYGQVNGSSVGSWWADHGRDLLARNLRYFKGRTDVNESLLVTLRTKPEHFWYFNNGITLLCSKLGKKPIAGASRDFGVFECEGVSVVNGAQTVGVVGALGAGHEDNLKDIQIPVRLISLEDCPDGFDKEVTRATNTQNRIENRDFAALDPNQRRLASEFLLDGKHYAYKSGDDGARSSESCSIVEATVALACADSDVALAVQAKRELGRLWDDIEAAPYKRLFNDETTSSEVWNAVEMMRTVDARLRVSAGGSGAKDAMVAVHGNRLILHWVFMHPAVRPFRGENSELEALKRDAVGICDLALDLLVGDISSNFAGAYLASLFKNLRKCKEIDKRLAPELRGPDVPKPRSIEKSGQTRLWPAFPLPEA